MTDGVVRKANSSEEILKLLGGKSLFLPKFEIKLRKSEIKLRKSEMKLRKNEMKVRKNLPFLPWKTRISSVETVATVSSRKSDKLGSSP